MPIATASQTIGPYWHLLEDQSWADLTRFGAEGERIAIAGRLTDGAGAPVTDGCVEILAEPTRRPPRRFPGSAGRRRTRRASSGW